MSRISELGNKYNNESSHKEEIKATTPFPNETKKPEKSRARRKNPLKKSETEPLPVENGFENSISSITEDDFIEEEVSKKRTNRIVTMIMLILCCYFAFLIFGALETEYQYNDKGQVEAVAVKYEDLKKQKNFNIIKVQYEKCRILYEDILQIDARLAEGIEDPLLLATEYEGLLKDAETLSTKTNALECEAEYTEIKNMMGNWIAVYVRTYLSDMSSGILNNDTATASNALTAKDYVYDSFLNITNSVIAIGDTIPGIDLTNIKEWSPDKYIEQFLIGATK